LPWVDLRSAEQQQRRHSPLNAAAPAIAQQAAAKALASADPSAASTDPSSAALSHRLKPIIEADADPLAP